MVTNTYKKSDGAVSEGLGNGGYEYVKNNPHEFANYFIGQNSFTENDLKTWADIVLLEIKIEYDNETKDIVIESYIQEVKINCKECSTDQLKIIEEFSTILKKKWKEYLTQIEN